MLYTPPKTGAPPWPTATIRQHLRAMYANPSGEHGSIVARPYAYLEEVGDQAGGYGPKQYADALVMHCWKSGKYGWELHGYEIKASRADWLTERRDPGKCTRIKAYCDRWWLVVGDAKIVKPGELDEADFEDWGLVVPVDEGHGSWALQVTKDATKLEPQPISRAFLGAIMRRMNEQSLDTQLLQQVEERGYQQGKMMALNGDIHLTDTQRRITRLRDQMNMEVGILNQILKDSKSKVT